MSEVFNFISELPKWVWVILVVFVILKSGTAYKVLWDYEVEFPFVDGIGYGEVDFECKESKDVTRNFITVKLCLDSAHQDKDAEIYLKNELVYTYPKEKNVGSRGGLSSSIDIEQPNVGDVVSVRIDGKELFVGSLARD